MAGDPEIRVSVTASTSAATSQIEDFGARTKAAMAAYEAAAAKGATTSKALGAAFDQAMASGANFTEAMERATASVQRYSTSTTSAVQATTHVVPQFAAASGALRELEGNFSHNIRAAERFLSTTLGLGPILQAAFPVVGALAMGGVLVSIGQDLAKFATDAGELGRELGTGWLDGAIAQVTGLAKEIKQADDELLKLATDRDRARSKQESEDVEHARLEAQNAALQRGLKTSQAAAEGQKAADAVRYAQLQRQIDALEQIKKLNAQTAEQLGKQAESQDELSRVGSIGIAKIRKEQEVAVSQYNSALKDQQVLIEEKNDLELKSSIAQQREDRAGVTKEKPNKEHTLVAQLGLDEAREKLRQLKEETRDLESNFTATFEKTNRELNNSIEQEKKQQEEVVRQYREKVRYAAEAAQAAQTEAQAQHSIAVAQIQAAEAIGQLSRTGADQARAAADAELYRERLEAIDEELSKLVPHTEEYNRVLRQRDQLVAAQKVSGIQDQTRTTQDLAAPYVKAAQTINQAWLGMQDKLIFGTRFVGQAFANMGVSMLESVARSFEQMLVKQLQYEIQSRIAHQVSNQAKLASDAQTAAAGDAINRTSALKEEFINAKVAATAAFKGVMNHVPPPLNFILAPVAAAAAFAGTLAVGAFEKGGIITGPTMALMGEAGSEAVLPHRLTNMLMSAANHYGGDTTNSNTSVHSTFNAHGITDRNFRDMARRHSDVIFDAAHSAVRTGKRRVG